MTASAVDGFIDRLAAVPAGPDWTNFFDHSQPSNALRRHNLGTYLTAMLERRPEVLLVGEAPGFRGMRLTGVPFTNRAMFEGPANSFGLFGAGAGYSVPPDAAGVPLEPTATVMWQVLGELNVLPLLWSAFPWHPHLPGKPLSNRTPRPAEVALGTSFWQELSQIFEVRSVVAVGNIAHRSLLRSGREVPKIRHPAHGGRAGFKRGLEQLLVK